MNVESDYDTDSDASESDAYFSDAGAFLNSSTETEPEAFHITASKRKASSGALLKPEAQVLVEVDSAAAQPVRRSRKNLQKGKSQLQSKEAAEAAEDAKLDALIQLASAKAAAKALAEKEAAVIRIAAEKAPRLDEEEEAKRKAKMKKRFQSKLKKIKYLGEEEIFMQIFNLVCRINPNHGQDFKKWCGYFGQCPAESTEKKGAEFCNYLHQTFGHDFVVDNMVHLVCLINQELKQRFMLAFFNLTDLLEWLVGGADLASECNLSVIVDFTDVLPKELVLRHDEDWLLLFDKENNAQVKIWPWFKVSAFGPLPHASVGKQTFGFTVCAQKFIVDVDYSQAVNRIFQRRVQAGAGEKAIPPPPPKKQTSPKMPA
jgi:hypothetical protein